MILDTILIPSGLGRLIGSCLGQYLDNDRRKTKSILAGPLAEADSKVFESNIFNITNRLDDFLSSGEKEIALLVLGKIQSGKTANLLGTVAWAADQKVSLAVIFTGVTEALNDQTEKRINRDLKTNLEEQFVKVFQVPTRASGENYEKLLSDLTKWITRRISGSIEGLIKPLPVLVTLKNPSRVKTLHSLISALQGKFGNDLVSLLIDDEADQASQNAGARKRKITPTYAAISSLRDLDSRNILLSYTATPQAVLLTERNGRLRPNFCVTVEPRSNYFGLENAVSPDFENNRVEVNDWLLKPSQMTSSPRSLRDALIRFVCTSWIRFVSPDLFYASSGLSGELLKGQLRSVQMLVHESGSVKEHKKVYEFVTWEIERLMEGLVAALQNRLTNAQMFELINEWKEGLEGVSKAVSPEIQSKINQSIDMDFFRQVANLLDDSTVLVVNSDPDKPGPGDDIPIENEVWEQSKLWILIGGDILGRGLTIPLLTTTYFLRHAKSPNFDTVSQQMRFCGYRSTYSQFTHLFAQGQTLGIFEVMNEIDSAVWRLAKKWDQEELNILDEMPVVMYASKPNVRLEPCRKAVRDPDLIDRKIKGDSIFSSRDIFNPVRARENLANLQTFVSESKLKAQVRENWYIYREPSDQQMQRLLSSWETNPAETSFLVGAAELFVPELEELGLSNIPRNIMIHKTLLENIACDADVFLAGIEMTRSISETGASISLPKWKKSFKSIPILGNSKNVWPVLSVPHIGGGQRADRDKYSPDSTTLLIEPSFGHMGKGKSGTKVVAGIALTLMSPPGFEVRIIGLESRLSSLGPHNVE
jgi:hypothetical protein